MTIAQPPSVLARARDARLRREVARHSDVRCCRYRCDRPFTHVSNEGNDHPDLHWCAEHAPAFATHVDRRPWWQGPTSADHVAWGRAAGRASGQARTA